MSNVRVPPWTLGWRLKRSLALTDMTADQMGVELNRKRGAVSNWMNDHGAPPAKPFIREWARLCEVPYRWLLTGEGSHEEPVNYTKAGRGKVAASDDAAAHAALDDWERAES